MASNVYEQLNSLLYVEDINEAESNPSSLGSGDWAGEFSLASGSIKSPNFVSGSAGWSIDADGNIEANNGTFRGDISASTITGSTFQTATTGQRITITSSDNFIKWYDSTDTEVVRVGGSSFNAISITPNSTTYTGLNFSTSYNVQARGLNIQHLGTGANNNISIINTANAGSGELFYGAISGTGEGIFLDRSSGAGTASLLDLLDSTANNSKLLEVRKTSTGTGTIASISSAGSGVTLSILNTNASRSTNPVMTIDGTGGDAASEILKLTKTTSGDVLNIVQTENDAYSLIGLHMNIANAGSGLEYAFRFDGAEFDSTKTTSVSGQIGVIRVYGGATGYIPVYSSAT